MSTSLRSGDGSPARAKRFPEEPAVSGEVERYLSSNNLVGDEPVIRKV